MEQPLTAKRNLLGYAVPLGTSATLSEYTEKVLIPFFVSQLQSCDRVDVVWDSYRADSVKEAIRGKRGKGNRKKVADNTKLPRDWQSFIKDPSNKVDMFYFLSEKINGVRCPEDKCIYITQGENVLPSSPLQAVEKCNREEVDTRILVHIRGLGLSGCPKRTCFFELRNIKAC